MYEFRAATLQDAVRLAVRGPVLEAKRLAKRPARYDFAGRMRLGSVLFVGEGNFSFALAMARLPRAPTRTFVATAYEAESDLTDAARRNAAHLTQLGATVRTEVDATRLSASFGRRRFRTIVFQFPNVASRAALYGQNPKHVLMTRFLKSSRGHLERGGAVAVSTVDSPFYEGSFKMEEAARKVGLAAPEIYDFNPDAIRGYAHQNTADGDSALDGHDAFATFVFHA
jgi:hypothetical protein